MLKIVFKNPPVFYKLSYKAILIIFFFINLNLVGLISGAATEIPETIPTAEKVLLDFQNIPVRTALYQLAKLMGFNLLIDEQVQGQISLHLTAISAQQAFDLILKLQGLEKQQIANMWFIAPHSTFLTRQQALREIEYQRSELDTLQSKRIRVRYREARDMAELFLGKNPPKRSTALMQLTVDIPSNSLWIQDTPTRIEALEQLIKAFDYPMQQILIEARIVNIDQGKERELGIRFGLTHPPHLSGRLEAVNNLREGEETEATQIPLSQRLNIDLPAQRLPEAQQLL
jgi:type IV pilus assembly protein PilQ